jgi:hypothetical protein
MPPPRQATRAYAVLERIVANFDDDEDVKALL